MKVAFRVMHTLI